MQTSNFPMAKSEIKCILMDIEGTTTSVSFVYDVLFPYFIENIEDLLSIDSLSVEEAFDNVKKLVLEENNTVLLTRQDCIPFLLRWCKEDRKLTSLKFLQGVVWEKGYILGKLVSHVYDDVPPALKLWWTANIELAVFSSGSVEAQKLIFKFAEYGNLSSYFSAYFDTVVGPKRAESTYLKIAASLKIATSSILFLSDIREELIAADQAGMATIQLVRPGTIANWKYTVESFNEIVL